VRHNAKTGEGLSHYEAERAGAVAADQLGDDRRDRDGAGRSRWCYGVNNQTGNFCRSLRNTAIDCGLDTN
jgi:hypothetical protein